jgi:hypothetical protein
VSSYDPTDHAYSGLRSLDPVQVSQMAKYLETVYVSGWQCSSTASSTNEPGPDLAGEQRTRSDDLAYYTDDLFHCIRLVGFLSDTEETCTKLTLPLYTA